MTEAELTYARQDLTDAIRCAPDIASDRWMHYVDELRAVEFEMSWRAGKRTHRMIAKGWGVLQNDKQRMSSIIHLGLDRLLSNQKV